MENLTKENSTDENSKKPWYQAKAYHILTFISIITAILTALFTIKEDVIGLFRSDTAELYKILLCLINMVVLATFCFWTIKVPELVFKKVYSKDDRGNRISGQRHYSSLLDEMKKGVHHTDDDAIKYNVRVNALVVQLRNTIVFYAIFLIIVYSIYIFDSNKNPHHKLFTIMEDTFNYLSSVFVYLSFKVLYNKTLNDKNKTSFFFMDTVLFTIMYGIIYIVYGLNNTDEIISNRLSLFAGMVNGIAMVLLFSRYISMAHMVKKIEEISYPKIFFSYGPKLFYRGIIYLLPLYAIIQPLFGTFHIDIFGPAIIFENCVFLLCFIGKLFFLFVTYILIEKKILHLYLHLVITRLDATTWFDKCFVLPSK